MKTKEEWIKELAWNHMWKVVISVKLIKRLKR